MKTRVAHLTTVHRLTDGRIFERECTTLSEAGYEVILIGPGSSDVRSNRVSIRVIGPPSNRWRRVTTTMMNVYKVALAVRASIYHFHDPELIPLGLLLKRRSVSVIYDIHEDVPRQILNKRWIPGWMRTGVAAVAGLCERVAGTFADGLVAATPTIAQRFPSAKTVVVQNFPRLSQMIDGVPYRERPPLVVYTGGIAVDRGFSEMISAIGMLPPVLGARLVIAGTCESPVLLEQARQLSGWQRVRFLGWCDREGIRQLLEQARMGLVIDHPTPNNLLGYSTKMFEYMAAGIPVIVSNFPLWDRIVAEERCGITVDPLSPVEISQAIRYLLEHPEEAADMGWRGAEAVRRKYNWETESVKLLRLYASITRADTVTCS